jgi:hypothetical protein
MKCLYFLRKYMGQMVGAGAEIFNQLVPEPHKNGPAPQHYSFLLLPTPPFVVDSKIFVTDPDPTF